MPAAFFSRTAAAEGPWYNKGKGRSGLKVITTGIGQTFSRESVLALNAFAEFHDVHALLTSVLGPERRARGSPPYSCNLQLDVGLDFLAFLKSSKWY